jgi:hypothetical protein
MQFEASVFIALDVSSVIVHSPVLLIRNFASYLHRTRGIPGYSAVGGPLVSPSEEGRHRS